MATINWRALFMHHYYYLKTYYCGTTDVSLLYYAL